jgi:hypothetical protein
MINFLTFWNHASIFLICFCLPGIVFTLDGIRIIRKKKVVSVGMDSHFRWRKPIVIKGDRAIVDGKLEIAFGILVFLVGLCPSIGIFLQR